MNILFAILLGIIQGITEFLPVSSSALTSLVQERLSFTETPVLLMSAALHAGTLFACLWVYRRSFFKVFEAYGGILKDLFRNLRVSYRNARFGENGSYARIFGNVSRSLAGMIFFTTLPAAFIGFALRKAADSDSSRLMISGMGFLATSILLLVAALMPRELCSGRDLTMRKSFLAGIAEGFAVLPGVSRFGVVYASSQILGMHRKTAARFALLSILPISMGAILYELTIGMEAVSPGGGMILEMIAGAAAAYITGSRMVRLAMKLTKKNALRLFTAVNVIFGVICIISYAAN